MDSLQENLVGQALQVLPRNLHAEDGDKGIKAPIVYSFNEATNHDNEALNYLHLNGVTGEIRLIREWPQWMAPVTLVVRATQLDNKDRYTLTTLTITRNRSFATSLHQQQQQHQHDWSNNSTRRSQTASSGQQRLDSEEFGIEFAQANYSCVVPENTQIGDKVLKVSAQNKQKHQTTTMSSIMRNHKKRLNGNNNDNLDDHVDLVVTSSSLNSTSDHQLTNNNNNSTTRATSTTAKQAAVLYQLLDVELEQFGINGLGDIYLKRELDYEHKQAHEFRVLATQGKYSDIVHVQVHVLNVNDNAPKVSFSPLSSYAVYSQFCPVIFVAF